MTLAPVARVDLFGGGRSACTWSACSSPALLCLLESGSADCPTLQAAWANYDLIIVVVIVLASGPCPASLLIISPGLAGPQMWKESQVSHYPKPSSPLLLGRPLLAPTPPSLMALFIRVYAIFLINLLIFNQLSDDGDLKFIPHHS